MKIGKIRFKNPRTIWNIDGTHNKAGTINFFVNLQVRAGPQIKEMKFLVTDLGEDEIVLGYPWLAAFQPKINWAEAVLEEDMQPLVIKTIRLNENAEVERVRKAWVKRAKAMATPGEEIFVFKMDQELIRKTSTSAQMAAKARPKEEKTWDQIVPPQYHKWEKVFSEEEAKRYPEHQPWDIEIDFVPEAPKILDCKIYPLTLDEQGKLDAYIKENLDKKIHSTIKIAVFVTLLLCWEEGWETTSCSGLQETQLLHGTRSIPTSIDPGTSGSSKGRPTLHKDGRPSRI